MPIEFNPIAHIHTCYPEKFGVPRQPGIVPEAWGEIVFQPPFRNTEALRGLEGFSHLWLIFIFDQALRDEWQPTVRPPRLGGNKKIGVFASRSPFRPNPIGLSCVSIESIDLDHKNAPVIHVKGVDLVDGSPILDIKPYIPYADSIENANGGFAHQPPEALPVKWSEDINLTKLTKRLIEATISADPRPAYQKGDRGREYGCSVDHFNVRWQVHKNEAFITSCIPI